MSKLATIAVVLFLGFVTTCGTALGLDLLYNFEGDSGTVATDKITSDGTQDGELLGNVTFDAFVAPWGTQSAFFDIPDPLPPVAPPYSTMEITDTILGFDFSLTVAGFLDNREAGLDFTRIFSSYRGTGPLGTDRIILDVDATGGQIPGLRAIINNVSVVTDSPPANLFDPGYHHYAMTVNAGDVRIYLDGAEVVNGNVGTGYTNDFNIFIGEDPHDGGGSANEQVIGAYDEVLVIDRALSGADIATLAGGAPVSSVVTPQAGERAVYYDFEGDSGQTATDKFATDGAQDGILILNSSIDQTPANARLGSGSAQFDDPLAGTNKFSQINVGAVGSLGTTFTLSTVVNMTSAGYASDGLTRLFSTFRGTGPIQENELIFDVNPDADIADIGLRLVLPGGESVTAPDTFTLFEDHTMTAVYDDGSVALYLDGIEVAIGFTSGGEIDLGPLELKIGEDIGGSVNENFQGNMDDVLILSCALTAQQVADLHAIGADALLPTLEPCSSAAADFNQDGVVDGQDLTNWETGFGQFTGNAEQSDGDANSDGIVDGADFLIWQQQFDPSGSAVTSIPEPGSLVLIFLAMLSCVAFLRRK